MSATDAARIVRPADRLEVAQAPDARVDVEGLGRLIDGRWWELRRASRDLALEPRFQRPEHLGIEEYRARVLDQLRELARRGESTRGFPASVGGEGNPGGNLAAFSELFVSDPSLQIKAGVQWGLFGSAILHLGTEEHHERWLRGVIDLTIPGCFAMTETGHGSDVSSIGTTATYDARAREFVIHTPVTAARKEYIGNAAAHGIAAVVFAQLITGGVNHGVHAFYVPLRERDRDGELRFCPGVDGADDGVKGGLGGVDNGQLWFDHVRIPRTNLLNRYGDVADDGTYSSPIASPGRRFFTMLGTLVQGRVSLGSAAAGASKVAMAIAIRYGNERRQFSSGDSEEVVLLDYQRHQRRLLPLLARTYAAAFATDELLETYHEVFAEGGDDSDREHLETLAAAIKPAATWLALESLQEAREACGGAGFMAENRLVGLRQDFDVYVTFEGDNNVLLQLVGKRLLTDAARDMKGADAAAIARVVVQRATDSTMRRLPLRRVAQNVQDSASIARSVGHLRDPEVQRAFLADRVETMIGDIAWDLRRAKDLPPEEAMDVFNARQEELIGAAYAHAELLQWEAFTAAVEKVDDAGTRTVLTWLRDLYGLERIEKNLAWYLVNGRISAQRARAVTSYINRLLPRLRVHAGDLVEAFGLTEGHLRAPIAGGAEARRQDEARDHRRRLRASGNAPVDAAAHHRAQQVRR